tara:strand:- start:3046 stop:4131 length:1086 start_codon:yes stop_codon:yes gene_type:complete
MINRSYIIAGSVAVAASLWVLSGQWTTQNSAAEAPNAAETAPVSQTRAVRVKTIAARPWQRKVVVRGQTAASRTVEVRAETAGRIDAVPVKEGTAVKAGDIIARIAPAERTASLAEAKALLHQRQVELRAADALAKKGFRSDTKLAEAQAQYDAARARIAQIETDISRTRIASPFDGVLESRHVELGDYLQTGDKVAKIVDLNPVLVIGDVSEREIQGLRKGMAASATLVDGSRLEGTIRFIGSVADPVTRTFRIELAVPNPKIRVRDGITSQMEIAIETRPAHFLTPALLTLDPAGRLGVKGLDRDDRVIFYPVRILADGSGGIWVDGLPESLRIISVGQEFVRAGQKVKPVADKTGPGS